MNRFLVTLSFFFIQSAFCQEFNFDYLSSYEYRKKENDSVTRTYVIFGNSSTEDYLLIIRTVKDQPKRNSIYDFRTNKEYVVNDLFELISTHQLKINNCKDYLNKYIVAYVSPDGRNYYNIKRYKDNQKTKLINQSYYFTKPSTITKNQHFCFPPLIFPLRCEKFKLENNEIITEANFVEDNKSIHFYKLIDFKKTDFKIKIGD